MIGIDRRRNSLESHLVTSSIIRFGQEMLPETRYDLPMKNMKKEQTC